MIDLSLIGLAFSAGTIAFLNPCSFALLPAYLSYFLGEKETSESMPEALLRGLKKGFEATLGFATVFLSIGVLVSYIGLQIKSLVPPVLLLVGGLLIVLGFLWVLDIQALSLSNYGVEVELPRSSFFMFGIAYAFGSLTCVFPVFLMLISSTLGVGNFLSGFVVFLSFMLGMGTLMITVSVSVALSKTLLIEKFEEAKKYITRISGIILIAAGILLIYHWITTYFI